MADRKEKCVCRLCYYETIDTVDIFSQKGIDFDYEGKIKKYLYLSVSTMDRYPKTCCWMCTQNLETFHRFYEKINEIQRSTLKEDYESIVIQPRFDANPSNVDSMKKCESDNKTVIDDDGNMYEIIISSVENDVTSKDDDTEMEEYELLEVDVCDSEMIDSKQIVSEIYESANLADEDVIDLGVVSNQKQLEDLSTIKSNEAQERPAFQSTRRSNRLQKQSTDRIVVEQKPKRVVKKETLVQLKSRKNSIEPVESTSSAKAASESNNLQYDHDETTQEGESDDEFPARNSDDEDWPSQMTLDEFPKEIIRDGLLLVKGKQLMSMICRFYNLECKEGCRKRRFRHLHALFDHYKNHHNESGYLECCQTKLVRQPAIIMHMARHLQPDAFKCDECGYIVTRPRFLQSHKQTHLPEDQKPYACPQDGCTRKFCWKSALRIHLISHQPVSERKQYICQCGRSYDTPGGLSTHKKQVHAPKSSNSLTNICHLCAKNFATRTGLQEHMQTIHQPREKGQVQCTELNCGKWLMNYRCLKTHMILHSNIELHCDQCDYVTKKKVLLNRHLLTQHSTLKPFICNLCGRSFKMKRALTVHLAQHGSRTVYQCPFCDRSFNSSTNFYTHRKNSHPKELSELLQQKAEDSRRKRIEAGIEEDPNSSSAADNNSNNSFDPNAEDVIILQI